MKHLSTFLTLLLLITAAGCANSEASYAIKRANREAIANGSPFRLHAETVNGATVFVRTMLDVPHGPTAADSVLKTDILALIKKAEGSQRRGEPKIEDTRILPDGREVWLLKNKAIGQGVAYVITLNPTSVGGTTILMDGPILFSKKSPK